MSAHTMVVNAQARTPGGKGAVSRLKATGKVPAIAYGKDLAATALAIAPEQVLAILASERGQNTVVDLKVEGANSLLAMIKDYTYHPVTRKLRHIDFIEVKLDRPVEVEVPLIALGKAVGVTLGGVLRQVFRTIPVRSLPDRIPLKIEIDISSLKLNEAVSSKDLKLAEGVEVLLPAELTLVAVVAPEKDRTEDEAAAVPGAAAAGAAVAPAAGAKDAKAAPAAAKDAKKK